MRDPQIKKILILGSGPIVIGQACEFDYSGTQACKVLMEKGYEVVLVNSNPATIMTDREMATRVYIEPLDVSSVEKILKKERPDAVIPTLGGQTALNLGLALDEKGILKKYQCKMLGATAEVIARAENRELFKNILKKIGAKAPDSQLATNMDDGLAFAKGQGFPLILRPNYTLGGGGGGVVYSMEEFRAKLALGLHESPTGEVLVEVSILGWKEFELEIMRDCAGTFVVICSIENVDPCGVHTGDSITVAPQQTLTDRQYQAMRDEARKIVHEVGVETGGANIQFAVDPKTGERVVIEMNPRVSRSSALASKATGFPIAKIAALLAVGYTLEEIQNDITKTTPACFEPALDYIVTKIPRFAFDKFVGAKDELSTQMKSVGEVMGVGRTFKESFMKALSSLEVEDFEEFPDNITEEQLNVPHSKRIYYILQALRSGWSIEDVAKITKITPWFIEQLATIVCVENDLLMNSLKVGAKNNLSTGGSVKIHTWSKETVLKAKRCGLTDKRIATLWGETEQNIAEFRREQGITPVFFPVDTCAGEFFSATPYYYSTYWSQKNTYQKKDKVIVLLGSGPNRIGQGVEFDYSCVRSIAEFQRCGYRVALVNCNPETVSTDYDISDELYFEPLTVEAVVEVLHRVQPEAVVCQLGGQTPINIAKGIEAAGFKILGTSLKSMDLAEDRGQFIDICNRLGFKIPKAGMVHKYSEALALVNTIGFPVMCRPSYVLGGRCMEIIENVVDLEDYFLRQGSLFSKEAPCLIDQFLERALELDVDMVLGSDWHKLGGIVEHIEAAGIHSGDSMGVLPPQRLKPKVRETLETLCVALGRALKIQGFLNLQLAIKDDEVYIIEANPRSSRSLPFVSKATGIPLVDIGVQALLGYKSEAVNLAQYPCWSKAPFVSVKSVIFPFKKFVEADSILGPEMKSTGEAMGRGLDFAEALIKAFQSSDMSLPKSGEVFLSLRAKDKEELLPVIKDLDTMGYSLSATGGTAKFIKDHNIACTVVNKVREGRPHCVDRIRSGEVSLVINTTSGRKSIEASFSIRRSCTDYHVPCLTESDSVKAFNIALKRMRKKDLEVFPL